MPMITLSLARRSLLAVASALALLLAAAACSSGYEVPLPEGYQPAQGDLDCMADDEPSQGDVCTQDCLTATCASGMGRRVCTCSGGVFLQCACLPPEAWPYDDVPVAPYCDKISGRPRYLAGERCTGDATCQSTTHPEQGCRCVMNQWQCNAADVPVGAPACEDFGSGVIGLLDKRSCRDEGFETWALCVARNYNPDGTSPRGCICLADGNWKCGATNRWYRAP